MVVVVVVGGWLDVRGETEGAIHGGWTRRVATSHFKPAKTGQPSPPSTKPEFERSVFFKWELKK